MKKLFIIAILSCNFLNAQNVFPTTGNVGIGTINPINSLTITTSPAANDAHIFFGEPLSTAGQASAKLTFAGLGIQHAGFSWVPGTTLDNGKLHLSFGGNDNGMNNPIKATFQSNGNVGIGTVSPSNIQGWDRVVDVAGLNHSKILATSSNATYKTGIFSHTSWHGGGGFIGTESNHNLHLITGYTPKVTILTDGNVGIGTVSPSNIQSWGRVLDVAGIDNSKILATSSNATYKTGIFSHTSWHGGGGFIGTESNHNLHLITGYTPK
ncbi:MAG TPA: hypothetical protein VF677_11150, partial [Flavobacterium sp.]